MRAAEKLRRPPRRRTATRRRPQLTAAALGAALATALSGCGEQPQTVTRQYLAFGTLVELSIHTERASRAQAAAEQLRDQLDTWHRQWHPWEGEGLARINRRLASGQPAQASPELTAMLQRAAELSRITGGRFDPAVGGLVRLWGFDDSDAPPQQPPPDSAVQAWKRDRPRISDLEISGQQLTTARRDLQLDLGGFAKGHALDRAVAMLADKGIEHALVNAGGDLRVMGRHGNRPWRIGIRAPRGNGVFAAVEVADGEAVFTSGDYERYFQWQGRRYHHILDPGTGRPARGLQSVTVISGQGAKADAAATALFVAGEQWPEVARAMGLNQVMVVTADGSVELTEAMAQRVRFVGEAPERVERLSWQ